MVVGVGDRHGFEGEAIALPPSPWQKTNPWVGLLRTSTSLPLHR